MVSTLESRINLAFSEAKTRNPSLTKTDIWRACRISSGAVTGWFNGETKTIKGENARIVAELLGVSRDWLAEGRGPMRPSNVEPGPDIHGTVPLISWVQAGQWQEVIDNLHPGQGERIETVYRVRERSYALRVRGDSMEPKFPDGAILIVEPDENPQPGQFIIVRQNGDEAVFKQLIQDGDKLYLKPLNPRYPILELNPNSVFCGVVKRVEMDV